MLSVGPVFKNAAPSHSSLHMKLLMWSTCQKLWGQLWAELRIEKGLPARCLIHPVSFGIM